MSAQQVRAAFRAKVDGLLTAAGYTFVESINRAEPGITMPARFYTLSFLPANDEPRSLGVPALFRESGTVSVLIFSPQQSDDTEGVAAAETVRAQLVHWVDPTGAVRVQSVNPPTDMDAGDMRGNYYGITVGVLYTFDRIT